MAARIRARNPNTNRLVYEDSRAGRKLRREGWHVNLAGTEWVPGAPDAVERDGRVFALNPLTGRMADVEGDVADDLAAAGYVLPPVREDGTQGGWTERDELLRVPLTGVYTREELDDVLAEARLAAAGGPLTVEIAGRSFVLEGAHDDDYIHLMYVVAASREDAGLPYPQSYDEMLDALDAALQANERAADPNLTEAERQEAEALGFGGITLLYAAGPAGQAALLQAAGGHCFADCLEQWAAERELDIDFSAYRAPEFEMVTDQDIQAAANRHKLRIVIYTQASWPEPAWTFASPSRDARVVHLWTQACHLLLLPTSGKGKVALKFADEAKNPNIVFIRDTPEAVEAGTRTGALDLLLRRALRTEPVRLMVTVSKQCGVNVMGFVTPTRVVKSRHELSHLAPESWGVVGAALQLTRLKQEAMAPEALSELRKSNLAINYVMYQRPGVGGEDCAHYDVKSAFARYHLCRLYSGLPDWRCPPEYFPYDEALHEAILKGEVEGVAYVRRPEDAHYPLETCLRETLSVVPFPLLRLAHECGHAYEILGTICQKPTHDSPLARVTAVTDSKQAYSGVVGRMNMINASITVTSVSPAETDRFRAEGYKVIYQKQPEIGPEGNPRTRILPEAEGIGGYIGRPVVMVHTTEKKELDPVAPLVCAYIRAYTEITLYDDILRLLDAEGWEKVARIRVDGVYVLGGLSEEHEAYLANTGRWKEVETKRVPNGDGEDQIKARETTRMEAAWAQIADTEWAPHYGDEASRLRLSRRLFLTGPPGSGKTYTSKICTRNSRAVLTGTTWKAVRTIAGDGGGCTTARILHLWRQSPEAAVEFLKGTDRLVVDEASMLDQQDLIALDQACSEAGIALLCVGDLCQLPPVSTRQEPRVGLTIPFLEEHGFEVKRLRGSKRAAGDPLLTALCAELEAAIEANSPEAKETTALLLEILKRHCRVVSGTSPQQLLAELGPEARWVAGPNRVVKQVNAAAPSAYRVINLPAKNKRSRALVRGDVTLRHMDRLTAARAAELEIPAANLKDGRACTYHGVQGETIDAPLVLDVRRVWDARQLYVGATRTRRLDQLVIYE